MTSRLDVEIALHYPTQISSYQAHQRGEAARREARFNFITVDSSRTVKPRSDEPPSPLKRAWCVQQHLRLFPDLGCLGGCLRSWVSPEFCLPDISSNQSARLDPLRPSNPVPPRLSPDQFTTPWRQARRKGSRYSFTTSPVYDAKSRNRTCTYLHRRLAWLKHFIFSASLHTRAEVVIMSRGGYSLLPLVNLNFHMSRMQTTLRLM